MGQPDTTTRDHALPMTRLGSLLQVHPASVTSAVDRLETQGFVRRQRRSEDRRVVHAELTEAGAATVDAATDDLNAVFTDLGSDLGDDTGRDLTRLLGALRAGAGQHESPLVERDRAVVPDRRDDEARVGAADIDRDQLAFAHSPASASIAGASRTG